MTGQSSSFTDFESPVPIGSMYGMYTYIYHKNQPSVGKYTSPMDPMGYGISIFWTMFFSFQIWIFIKGGRPCIHHWRPGSFTRRISWVTWSWRSLKRKWSKKRRSPWPFLSWSPGYIVINMTGFLFHGLLPRNLTWNLKMMVSKRNLLFQGLLFRFHLNFQGCIFPLCSSHFCGSGLANGILVGWYWLSIVSNYA